MEAEPRKFYNSECETTEVHVYIREKGSKMPWGGDEKIMKEKKEAFKDLHHSQMY